MNNILFVNVVNYYVKVLIIIEESKY